MSSQDPIAIGDRRELFVEDHLLDRLEGDIRRRLHHPQPREVVVLTCLHFMCQAL